MKRLQRVLPCLLLCALLAGMLAAPASASPLSDVPEDFWAKQDIDRCVTLRYFYPEADGSFGVGKEMSRAEFLAVLCRTLGWEPASPARTFYDDVSEKAWYAGAVETAYRQGAVTSQDGSFRPDDLITRSEAASMLVRALGYGSIAGLIQGMSLPFQDVKANNGYIVMAYGLGLMDGTSVTAFSPDGHVTREQAAAIIMRLHDKLHGETTSRMGVAVSEKGLPELKGYEAVAVAAAKLAYNGEPQISTFMAAAESKAIQAAARAAGAKALLYVTGGAYHVREGESEKLAAVIFQTVEEGGYDGLFLDVADLTVVSQRDALTEAVRILREKLGERPLYVGAGAPSWKDAAFGYDYAALSQFADRLVLRFDYKKEIVAGRTVIPLEPLEQVYYALNRLRDVVDADKLALHLTSTGFIWEGREPESLAGEELTALAAEQTTRPHYSDRYACAYLVQEKGPDVWYLNGQAVKERTQLARLFGGGRLCLSDLNHALPEVLEAMP